MNFGTKKKKKRDWREEVASDSDSEELDEAQIAREFEEMERKREQQEGRRAKASPAPRAHAMPTERVAAAVLLRRIHSICWSVRAL